MKILSLSLDRSILEPDSIVARKTLEYAELSSRYIVIVPADKDTRVSLSPKAEVFGVAGSNRIFQLYKMYVLSKLLVRQHACNLVTSQDPFELGLIAYILKKKYKIVWHVQEHGDFFSQPYWRQESLLNAFRYRLGLFLIKRADSIRVVSQRIRKHLVDNIGIAAERISVVPVLTEQEIFSRNVKRNNPGKFIFLSLARFVSQKNLSLLIEAFVDVHKHLSQTRLRLVGRGTKEQTLRRLAKEKGLEDAVEFLPWTTDVVQEFADADAYVLSSDYEGWGRVIVEAAASRLPIIMTDVGCAGELIKNEESGLVVPIRNKEALVAAMLRLAGDQPLCERLADGAAENLKILPDKKKTLELYKESWKKAFY